MCYNIQYIEKRGKKYAERYKTVLPKNLNANDLPENLPAYYFVSGFSHPLLPLVIHSGIFLYEWGLIPFWMKDAQSAMEIKSKTLNAKGETVFEKPSFKRCIASQRALLGINGFYEWREYNQKKYPYFIHLQNTELFSLACIYDTWVDHASGEIKKTFSILTTAANPLMEKIHNVKKRMPLILKAEDEVEWIDPHRSSDKIKALIKPYPDQDMQAYSISFSASQPKFNRNIPEINQKVFFPELGEV